MRNLWIQILGTTGSRVYSLLVSLTVLSLTARWLGPAGRGEMAAALLWATLFHVVFHLSLNAVVLHQAGQDAPPRFFAAATGNLLAATGAGTVLGWLGMAGLYALRPQWFANVRGSVLAVAFLALPFLIWEHYGTSLLMISGRLAVYIRSVLASKTAVLLLVATFYFFGLGIHAFTFATVAGQLALCAAGFPAILGAAGGQPRFDGALMKRLLQGSSRLHPSAVATFLYGQVGVLIINRMLGNHATGVFQLATQLVDILLLVPYAANTVLFSHVGRSGPERVWGRQRAVLIKLLGAMVLIAGVAVLLAPLAIPLVAGRAFTPSIRVFQYLTAGAVLATISAVMTTQWIGRGLFVHYSIANLTAVGVNLALNVTLTPRLGINGAIIASLTAYLVMAAASAVLAWDCERIWRAAGRPKDESSPG